MSSKIIAIAIVNPHKLHSYSVGNIYNELLLHRIANDSVKFSDAMGIIYRGYTHCNEVVFEAINVPLIVEYAEDLICQV